MAEQIIDIITHLQFVAHDEGARKSAATVAQLTKEVQKLEDETKDYQQFLDKNRGKNAQHDKEAIAAIQKNTAAIKEKQKAIITEFQATEQLNKAITQEIGLLGSLNNQLEILKAKKAFATTAGELKAINVDIANVNKQIKGTGEAVGGAATKAFSGLRQLAYLIPGLGLAGIFNLAFEAIGRLFPQIEKYGRALLGLGGAQQDLNDAIKEGLKNSYVEVSNLDRVYAKTQNTALSIDERRESVNKLQKLFPAYFKNIEDEIILNGGAKDSYDELRKSIIATAKVKAIEGKLIEVYNNNFEKETKLRSNLKKAIAEENRERGKIVINQGVIGRADVQTDLNAKQANALRKQRRRQAQTELFEFESEQAEQLKVLTDALTEQEKLISYKTVESTAEEDAARKKRAADAKRASDQAAREQAESDKIIRESQLSLLDEEAREIRERELKHEEELKKLRKVTKQERLDFEQAFQDDLYDIRLKYQLKNLELIDKELAEINKRVEADFKEDVKMGAAIDAAKRKKIKEEQDFIKKNLENMQEYVRGLNAKAAKDRKKEIEDNIKGISDSVQAFGQLLDTITQASINNVDKEITAQQRRIDRATKYAERGGAELLELEEERLAALEEKREKYARRQLQINSVLALSNAIVAVTAAAAEGGPVLVAAVIAAIAAGYGVVNAFDEPLQLAEGTKSVEGKGTETSDSVPANLSKGERVMTAKTSKKFKPILDDIQDGMFPDQAALVSAIQGGKYSGMNYKAVIDSSTTNTTDSKGIIAAVERLNTTLEEHPVSKVIFDERGFGHYLMQQQARTLKRNKY